MVTNFETVKTAAIKYADDVRRVMTVDKAVLFGSYAKGTANEQSDIDVCFFLSGFDAKHRGDIICDLLRISDTSYKGIYFEPTIFPTSELENDNPFVKEIIRTGMEIE